MKLMLNNKKKLIKLIKATYIYVSLFQNKILLILCAKNKNFEWLIQVCNQNFFKASF
jgi:hypothetical protein